MVLPARDYQGVMVLQIIMSLLHSGPMVQPPGMASSVPCRKLEFGLSDNVAPATQWPPGFQGTKRQLRGLNEGREEEKGEDRE